MNSFWQKYFDYKIIGREKVDHQPTIIIEALPILQHEKNVLFGKIWLEENDGSIVKIEWYPRTIARTGKLKNKKLAPLPWNQPNLHFVSF